MKIPFLATPNDNPPAHPSKAFVGAGAQVERPRSYIGIEADRVALTKTVPPEGVYFQDIAEGRLYQWVGDRWETIGQTFLGDMALSDNMPITPRQTPRPFSVGGSVTAVGGPVGSGNPINSAVASEPGYTATEIQQATGDGNHALVDGNPAVTIMTFTPFVPLARSTRNDLYLWLTLDATLTGVEDLLLDILQNGVSIGTVASESGGSGLWVPPLIGGLVMTAPATGDVISIKASVTGGNLTVVVRPAGNAPNPSRGVLITTQVP